MYREHQETDQHLGLENLEARTSSWKSYNTMIQTALQKVMNKRIIQAPGNRTRYYQAPSETRVSLPKTQSNLMSNHSEDLNPVDERKWNEISAYDDVRGQTLE